MIPWKKGGLHGCGISVTVIVQFIFINFNITIIRKKKKKYDGIEIVKIKCKVIRDDGRMRQGLEMNESECSND